LRDIRYLRQANARGKLVVEMADGRVPADDVCDYQRQDTKVGLVGLAS
jgi:hypothetical protein